MSSWFSWYQFIKMYFFNKYNIKILYLDSWYNCTIIISEIPVMRVQDFLRSTFFKDDYFYKPRPFFRWFFLLMIIFDIFFYIWLILLDFFTNEFFSQIATCEFFIDNLFDCYFLQIIFYRCLFLLTFFLRMKFFYRWDMEC